MVRETNSKNISYHESEPKGRAEYNEVLPEVGVVLAQLFFSSLGVLFCFCRCLSCFGIGYTKPQCLGHTTTAQTHELQTTPDTVFEGGGN